MWNKRNTGLWRTALDNDRKLTQVPHVGQSSLSPNQPTLRQRHLRQQMIRWILYLVQYVRSAFFSQTGRRGTPFVSIKYSITTLSGMVDVMLYSRGLKSC